MMRVLILGGSGMLGHKMFQVLNGRFEAFATFRGFRVRCPVYEDVGENRTINGTDAMDFSTVAQAINWTKPDVVINCIGIVKQLPEAKDPVISIHTNALFPHHLAALCGVLGTRMIHISTDCVFSGRKGNYTERDTPDAEDLYGRTKLLGEVAREGCLTIRTSVIGRELTKQVSLLEWFLSNRGGSVRGYTNAIYTGFTTQALARIVGDLITYRPGLTGLYHISSAPISKYNLLVRIRDAMKLDIKVEPYQDYHCDRSLDSSRFLAETRYTVPGWYNMITGLAQDDTPYDE